MGVRQLDAGCQVGEPDSRLEEPASEQWHAGGVAKETRSQDDVDVGGHGEVAHGFDVLKPVLAVGVEGAKPLHG